MYNFYLFVILSICEQYTILYFKKNVTKKKTNYAAGKRFGGQGISIPLTMILHIFGLTLLAPIVLLLIVEAWRIREFQNPEPISLKFPYSFWKQENNFLRQSNTVFSLVRQAM